MIHEAVKLKNHCQTKKIAHIKFKIRNVLNNKNNLKVNEKNKKSLNVIG